MWLLSYLRLGPGPPGGVGVCAATGRLRLRISSRARPMLAWRQRRARDRVAWLAMETSLHTGGAGADRAPGRQTPLAAGPIHPARAARTPGPSRHAAAARAARLLHDLCHHPRRWGRRWIG